MDDIHVIITLITFFFSNLFAIYKIVDKLSDRLAKLEGKVEQIDKNLNMILRKMLDNGEK